MLNQDRPKHQRLPTKNGKLWFTHNHGNRCGHSPLDPMAAPAALDNRPFLLKKAANELRKYWTMPGAFPVFWGSQQPRTEQRDSMIAVASYLLAYCNIATLRVAVVCGPAPHVPTSRLYSLSANDISAALGIATDRVYSRLADLELAGWISCYPRSNGKKGTEKRAYASARYLTPKFFAALGLTTQLNKRRRKAQRDIKSAIDARTIGNPAALFARAMRRLAGGSASNTTILAPEHLAGRQGFKKFAAELRRTLNK